MIIDILDRRVGKTLALLDSLEGRRIYRHNKYELGLDRRNNICGIIQKACGILKFEHIAAVYERVEAELAARKAERVAG